jgi:hypothetical protein
MRWLVRSARGITAAALAFAATGAVAAGPRISIAGIRGDAGGKVMKQLAGGLCRKLDCVPAAKVKRGGRLDFGAMKEAGVDGALFGTVAKNRLELALLTDSLTPRRTWALPLGAGKTLSARAVDGVAADLAAELAPVARPKAVAPPRAAAPAGPRTVPAPKPVAPPDTAERSATPAPARPAPAKPAAKARPAAEEPADREEAAPARAVTTGARSLAILDVGGRVTRRRLDYSGVGTGSSVLQRFSADSIAGFAGRLEVYPLARSSDRWPGQIGVVGGYARSIGFKVEESSRPGVKHAATLTQLEAGVAYQARPLAGSELTVTPRVTYRKLTFTVSPVSGAVVPGLPDADLAGPSVGVDVGVPVVGRLGVFAGASYTSWTTAKDLVAGDPKFFPSGSASAFDVGGGVAAGLVGPLSVRLGVDYERTSYSLKGTSAYVATGATDTYLSVNAALRAAF